MTVLVEATFDSAQECPKIRHLTHMEEEEILPPDGIDFRLLFGHHKWVTISVHRLVRGLPVQETLEYGLVLLRNRIGIV